MRLFKISLVFILILSPFSSSAQVALDNWKVYTALSSVNDCTVDSKGRLWTASPGGLFIYDRSDSTFTTIRNELLSTDIKTVFADKSRELILIGCGDGTFEIIDEDLNITHITSIRDENFPNPVINDFEIIGDQVYIAGGFGLTVFNLTEKVFITTVRNFADLQSNPEVIDIYIVGSDIWLATSQGIVKSTFSMPIEVPASWERMDSFHTIIPSAITGYDDEVFFAADKTIYSYIDTGFVSIHKAEYEINGLHYDGQNLLFSNFFGVYSSSNKLYYEDYAKIISGFKIIGSDTLLLSNNNGLGLMDGNGIEYVKPNSPSGNIFSDLVVNDDGVLWCATDNLDEPRGLMRFDGNHWTNIQLKDYPGIASNRYYKISKHPDGRIIASNYSDGLLIVSDKDDMYFQHITAPFAPYSGGWLITGENAVDKNGVIWVINYGEESPGPVLVAIEDEWSYHSFYNIYNPSQRYYVTLAIDFNSTKWLGSNSAAKGLLYFNDNGTLDDPSDDTYGRVTKSDYTNLVSNTHNALAVDQLGMLWIGTPDGVSVIINPSAAVTGSSLIIRSLSRLIGNLTVNDILIDPQNNKWLATESGIWVLDPDGTEIIAQFDKSNSPLKTNKIISIALDINSGQTYIGTREGLFVASGLSIQPLTDYDIQCYPQPYKPQETELIIDGLAANSDIKIVSLNGELVRSISTTSRKTIWDGRNERGEMVKSGIYMIIATSEGASTESVAKIAIIND